MSIRVSVTDVDQLAYFRASEGEERELSLDELRERLMHRQPPGPDQRAGTAFHAVLEHTHPGQELTVVERDGFTFVFDLEGELTLPSVRELKGEREYEIAGELVTLVCKVDAFTGARVDDHKLTGRFEAERYADAFQWRANLSIFGADEFRYNVFENYDRDGRRVIHKLHPLTFYRYPELEHDVLNQLRDFVEFVKAYVPEYGQPRQQAA